MECLKCHSSKVVKNGTKNGHQYFKCKLCHTQFCDSTKVVGDFKLYAVVLYCYGFSMRTIGQALGYSNVAILKWLKDFNKNGVQNHLSKTEILQILSSMSSFFHEKMIEAVGHCSESLECSECTVHLCDSHTEATHHTEHDCDEGCVQDLERPKDCKNCEIHYCRTHNEWHKVLLKVDDIISGKANFEVPETLKGFVV